MTMHTEGVERPENVRAGNNPEQVYRTSGGEAYGGTSNRSASSHRLRGRNGSGGLGEVGRVLRDNPIPALLIGAGATWLALSALSHTERGAELMRHGGERRHRLAERTGEWRQKAGDYAHQARERAETLRHRGEEWTHRATDAFERQPLLIGAIGMALGAAVGASMPSTRHEDEWFGSYRDQLRDEAADYGREQAQRVAEAAEEALSPEDSQAGSKPRSESINRGSDAAPASQASPSVPGGSTGL